MSVPKFFMFFKPFLAAIADGELHTAKEVRQSIATALKLSEEDMSIMLPSGRHTVYTNRINWARTYLDKAGLIETPVRAKYRITKEGKKALQSGQEIDLKYLEQYDKFREFHQNDQKNGIDPVPVDPVEDESPIEMLDDAFKKVNSALAAELMDEVMNLTPSEFEQLVVKLLLKMGYGSGIDDAGIVTKPSDDGGIDGIIKEDQLGFSSIYIQAKQWAVDRTVNRPEIQKFAGALQGEKASKGLFITTAQFSQGARQYAENLHGSTIVLVDGSQMMKLMIKFGLGVSVEHVYEVKRIDSDFFTEGF